MSIGAGGTFGAVLLLGVALGPVPVAAQTPAVGTWTDPPARSAPPAAAVAAPTPAANAPAAKADGIRSGESRSGTIVETKPGVSAAVPRRAASRDGRRIREAKRARPALAEAPPTRVVRSRVVQRREAVRPAPRAAAARSFAQRSYARQSYAFDPGAMPVGRVDGPPHGERNPIFAEGDDRARRIAAAQAAGYLVVRARSVQFPDGRTLRTYRPYEDEDGLD